MRFGGEPTTIEEVAQFIRARAIPPMIAIPFCFSVSGAIATLTNYQTTTNLTGRILKVRGVTACKVGGAVALTVDVKVDGVSILGATISALTVKTVYEGNLLGVPSIPPAGSIAVDVLTGGSITDLNVILYCEVA
jgi:hypothetical protein